MIVPVWPSAVDEIVSQEFEVVTERSPSVFGGTEMALDLLIAEVFDELSVNAAKWLAERIPVREVKAGMLTVIRSVASEPAHFRLAEAARESESGPHE